MQFMDDAAFDSCVTDPPYHLTSVVKRFGAAKAAPAKDRDGLFQRQSRGFMGQTWDGGDIAFRVELWAEVLRVLKPGAYLLAFSSTRTYHRMACAIEDAGFEIRDQIGWTYGTGFPKSRNTDDGRGTALKPAWEPICMARKPLIGTVAKNIAAFGTGAINIDGCRIETNAQDQAYINERIGGFNNTRSIGGDGILGGGLTMDRAATYDASKGRWPANVIHDGSDEVLDAFPTAPGQQGRSSTNPETSKTRHVYGKLGHTDEAMEPRGDSGSAARFFYCAKASKADRAGSKHPTVKPISLIRYLARLVTPAGGHVLDPFAGSGTLAAAASAEGLRATLIEREPEYLADIRRRLILA